MFADKLKLKRSCQFNKLSLFFLCVFLSACATKSFKEKMVTSMMIGAAVGLVLGQIEDNNKNAMSLIYAGTGASAAAVYGLYAFDKSDHLEKENENLKIKLAEFDKMSLPKLLDQGGTLFQNPPPKELSHLVELGKWKRYKLDQWVQSQSEQNVWFRQVEMFEIIPPSVAQ